MSLTLNNGPNQAFAYEKLSTLTTAKGGTPATYDAGAGAQVGDSQQAVSTTNLRPVEALATVEVAPIRYRVDGGAPTTSDGHLVQAGETIALIGYAHIVNFKVINAVASNGAAVAITYFR